MGNQCCAAPTDVNDGGDLPKSVKKTTMDSIQLMEYKYPFYRMEARKMFSRLYGLGGDWVTFKDLEGILTGSIWKNQFEEGSEVY